MTGLGLQAWWNGWGVGRTYPLIPIGDDPPVDAVVAPVTPQIVPAPDDGPGGGTSGASGASGAGGPDGVGSADAGGAGGAHAGGTGGAGAPGEEPAGKRRRWWHVPKFLRNGLVIGVLVVVAWYVILPEVFAANKNITQLEHVNFLLLLLGLGLEVVSLFAYAKLTIVVLPPKSLSLSKAWRINLASLAVGHLIPGGTAAGTGASISLMTSEGLSGTDVGVATATMGIGSAVLLNAMLWLALIISIPLNGFRPVYEWVALVSLLLLGFFAALIAGFAQGDGWAVRVLRRLATRFRFIPEERLESIITQIAVRIKSFWSDPDLVRRGIIWAALNWLLDASCLWVCVLAFHHYINPIDLFVAYGVGNILAAIPLTPGGLGTVEVAVGALLRGFGVPTLIAAFAVLGWRLFNFWLPIPVGGGCYLSLRVERGTTLREMATNARRSRGRRTAGAGGKVKYFFRRSDASSGTESGPRGVVPPIG